MIRLLVPLVDVSARNHQGETALEVAASQSSSAAVVLELLGAAPSAGVPAAAGRTLLHHAASNPSPSAARALLAQGWDPEARDARHQTAAQVAARQAAQSTVAVWDRAMAVSIEARLAELGTEARALGRTHAAWGAATVARCDAQPAGIEMGGKLNTLEGPRERRAYTAALAREDETRAAWAASSRALGERYDGVVAWAASQVEAAQPGLTARVESSQAWLTEHPLPEAAEARVEATEARWEHLVMAQAAEQACAAYDEMIETMTQLAAARQAQAELEQARIWRPAQLFQRAQARQAAARLGEEVDALEQRVAEGVQAQQWSDESRSLAAAQAAAAAPNLAESIRRYEAQRVEAERPAEAARLREAREAAARVEEVLQAYEANPEDDRVQAIIVETYHRYQADYQAQIEARVHQQIILHNEKVDDLIKVREDLDRHPPGPNASRAEKDAWHQENRDLNQVQATIRKEADTLRDLTQFGPRQAGGKALKEIMDHQHPHLANAFRQIRAQ